MIRIDKVWGFEQIICNTPLYCSKFLHVKPGMQCSLHYHRKKDETFYVMSGDCRIEIGAASVVAKQGYTAHIHPGVPHRFSSKGGCILLETSTYHDDADVVRLEESRAA